MDFAWVWGQHAGLKTVVSAQGSPADPALGRSMGKGYKVVVCGMASVGKTAILEQLLYGKHTVGEIFLLFLGVGALFAFPESGLCGLSKSSN